ncbi:MAG: hypothetical protein HY922_06830 [Elusimicrobia bacterium]|nr:hypothetical protein [Elusimicrobiota bacterium]
MSRSGTIRHYPDFVSIFLPATLRWAFAWGLAAGRMQGGGGPAWEIYKQSLPVLFWDIAHNFESFPQGEPK